MFKLKLFEFTILLFISIIIIVPFENSFAEELEKIEFEIKYTNGDIVDFNSMKIIVYQDFDKTPIIEKNLIGNPDFIEVPINHKYKIEFYANAMYADVEYIQLNHNSKKLDVKIPLSGGLKLDVFYENGQKPISRATVLLKANNNEEIVRTHTNENGETQRFWIQSTTKQDNYYIADVYLDDIFLTSYYPIYIQAGIQNNQKIITNIPEIVEDLITINLYDGNAKIKSTNSTYNVILKNLKGDVVESSILDFRGDAYFSNIKSGTYKVKIKTGNINDENFWPETKINIIGELNKFNIIKNNFQSLEHNFEKNNSFELCNCIAFRLDDVQDYWLADTTIQIINLFDEKKIPLTVGVIGSVIGDDERITSILKKNLEKNSIEIANHSWNNDVLTDLEKIIQERYIADTNQKINEIFGVIPTSFIPPENIYDDGIIQILKSLGFTHISSHIDEESYPKIENGSFFITPAITQTAEFDKSINKWSITENEKIIADVVSGLDNYGYAVIMMHPQEFSLNDNEEYDSPNQESLNNLSLLLDEIYQLDSNLVKMREINSQKISIDAENTTEEDKSTDENVIESCNCVAFRLDDVQDYWLNNIQMSIMETFIENKTPLTIGIIGNAFGNDEKITDFIKNNIENDDNYLEIATRGMGLTSFTNYDKSQQSENLKQSQDNIESVLGIRPQIFIPPNNIFNSNTFEILKENKITHISSSLTNGDSPPFEFNNKDFYRFPQTSSTGKYNSSLNIFEKITNEQTIEEVIQSITNYGFAVVSIHPQEFSMIINSTHVNSVNEEQIKELEKLIKELNDKGYKIVPIGKINSNLIIHIPDWIKNNAGWWANGQIDDDSFIQGIQFLIKEDVLKIPSTTQSSSIVPNEIPVWIKNNAGWWANGQIDDNTFVQGIEYLVKNGIITY